MSPTATPGESAAALRAAADRLLARVGHWNAARWAGPVQSSTGPLTRPGRGTRTWVEAAGTARTAVEVDDGVEAVTRAELVFVLVQQLADAAADAEGQPRRPVPRLDSDLALPDQFRVMVADLVRASPPDHVLRGAAVLVDSTSHALEAAILVR